jgi:hypothetical protein
MNNNFHQIFTEVGKAKSKKEKIAILHNCSSPALKIILGSTFDPSVKWLLPEGDPPYKPLSENSDGEIGLSSELRRIYIFVEGPSPTQQNLKNSRREFLYIQMLESLNPNDAKIVIGMRNGKLPYKGLTKKLVCDAFPKLTEHWSK